MDSYAWLEHTSVQVSRHQRVFVFSLWYNRVILGLVIGAPWAKLDRNKAMLRGAILGLLVSFAFYSSTGFQDPISFLAGIVYGVILEAWLSRSIKTT